MQCKTAIALMLLAIAPQAHAETCNPSIEANDQMKFNLGALKGGAGDARVIAHTKVIGGGQSTSLLFPALKLKKGGDYTLFCSFPGHWTMMKDKFIFG